MSSRTCKKSLRITLVQSLVRTFNSAKNTFYKYFFISLILFSKQAYALDILSDTETESVVRKLITPILKVANITPTTLNIYIILDRNVNAFVIGGNNLFINTGLIATFNNPDVLKGVVAHELGHVTGGHVAMRQAEIQNLMSQSILINLLGAAAILGGAGEAGSALISGGLHAAQGNYLSFSRFQETAADTTAIKYLHDSHNTVKGLIQVFEHFEQETRRMREHINPYMQTHPLSNERLTITRQSLIKEDSSFKSSEDEKKEYSQIVAKLRGFTFPLNQLSINNQKDLPPPALLYEESIILYRNAKFAQAITILNDLIKQDPSNGYLYELKGQFLFESGHVQQAIESYKQAINLLPNKPLLLAEYAVVLVNSSNEAKGSSKNIILEESIVILNKVLNSRLNNNPYVYRQLAIAYGKLGKLNYSNLMLAEEACLLLKFNDAKKFIELAKKYNHNDEYVKLRIDDILKTLPTN
ncbi:MAG: M48 family metalloprotease [Rickettsiales bacterium]|nr:M48 family metalloprotease [Rickettsiales bacterium]